VENAPSAAMKTPNARSVIAESRMINSVGVRATIFMGRQQFAWVLTSDDDTVA
jgi:hypothetical protein